MMFTWSVCVYPALSFYPHRACFSKRYQMETEYGRGCANELDLYHGTKLDLVDIICHQNLDPRLAGDNVGKPDDIMVCVQRKTVFPLVLRGRQN